MAHKNKCNAKGLFIIVYVDRKRLQQIEYYTNYDMITVFIIKII